MANFVFNIAKGKAGYYCSLPGANSKLIVVVLQSTGLATDATLMDLATMGNVLANATEQTVMGRKTAASVVGTVDNTNDRLDVTFTNPVWTSATGNACGALVVCYDPDTTSSTDTTRIPLTKHDFVVTPNGANITAQLATTGFYRAA